MRLTDDELDEALAVAQSLNSLRLTAAVAELKERRARDLSDDDIEGLEFARWRLVEYAPESGSYVVRTKRALAALSKLTRGNR